MRGLVERVDELLGRRVSMRSLALVRILVGPVALMHLWPIASAALGGDTYRDRFHHPYLPWYPELPTAGYAALLVVGCVAAGAMTVGVATRAATATVFAVVAYHLLLSTTHVHNNRAYLVIVLGILALAPCGRALSFDAWSRRRRGISADELAPAWPIWLLRFECAVVYGASGFSKLVDPDWFGGTVTWGRVVTQEAMLRASVVPDAIADVLVDRSFHTVAAKLIVLTELFIAAGLWWRRTRPIAIVTAVVFHLTIEMSAAVQVFSYLGIAVLVVWAAPDLPRLSRVTAWPRSAAESPAPSG